MKLWSAQFASLLKDEGLRRGTRPVLRFLLLLFLIVVLFSLLFHLLMIHVEGQTHPWIAGPYFVLVTMTTLGFGDLVFESTIGRIYSVLVLMSGVVLLLSVLPFLFIRMVYLPWLEAHNRNRVAKSVPPDTKGHVIICSWDALAQGLIGRLRAQRIPHVVIEPSPDKAADLHEEGWPVLLSKRDSRQSFEALGVERARLIVANVGDAENTNIALTIREVSSGVPLLAFVDKEDSVDILQMAGANQVVSLKNLLGDHLATRVNAGNAQAHVFGRYHELHLAEFPAHNTPLAGKTVKETRLREVIGLRVLAIWERGKLMPARPTTLLSHQSVLVVMGSEKQIAALDELMIIYDPNPNPILVIGGGDVGRATASALKRRGIPASIIEKNPGLEEAASMVADKVFIGDAADLRVLELAGIERSPSVVLTTHDDAINIYLALYCRRLNPELRIVSRITHERNVEAVHRAGADLVLSHASLGIGIALAALQGHEAVLIGEGIDLFTIELPDALAGRTLAESMIGERTGLNIIAVRSAGEIVENPPADHLLEPGCELLALGTPEQLEAFHTLVSGKAKAVRRNGPSKVRAA